MKRLFVKLKLYVRKHKYILVCILLILVLYYFSIPRLLFPADYSTVVFDRNGDLIGARIANDGQWRFPEDTIVPLKFQQCLIQFEDKHFYYHPGFNPISLGKALIKNIKAHKVVSGGSTLTMQVIRLHRNGKNRTFMEKMIEVLLATRLECRYSKAKILKLYMTHAPFGGNVVGVNAASWRYFGRNASNLSWAESALLAVLPNSPAMIHPGKNRDNLLVKRNKLLGKLMKSSIIDQETYKLAILEPLPEKPLPLPDIATHLTENMKKNYPGRIIHSSIQRIVQENVNRLISDYYNQIKLNEIHNIAALIIEVKSGNPIAYVGNVPSENGLIEGQNVDCAQAPRSTGSILKPILYMAMQKEGLILPGTLIPDIPTRILGFKPENYDLGYDGAVPAKRALARSLNIPAVRMLQMYGIPKFQNVLQKLGMTTLTYSPDHYGLTLIIGGGEGKLLEIAGMYVKMARLLNDTYAGKPIANFPLGDGSQGASYLTFEALLEVNRPEEESGWVNLSSSRKIAWKTGTSYGFRDAWAIGTTPEYVVAVWVGNADGEGRPGLTGVGAAAPLMFRLFNLLPATSWFHKPYDDFEKLAVCRQSGYKAGPYCDDVDSIFVARAGVKTSLCPYHILIHTDVEGKYRVNSKCMSVDNMRHLHWFVLPPAMEYYYRKKNIYRELPPIKGGCNDENPTSPMELIYPTDVLKIFVPRELDGSPGRTVFEIAHRNPKAIIYWHLDSELLGTTKSIHQISFNPKAGKHLLTVVDNEGNTINRWFEVVDNKKGWE